ncbi:MAG: ComEC/Rec2 family competence protein [bacterium]
MKKSEIFLFVLLSFIIGIAVGLLKEVSFLMVYICLLADLVFLALFWKNINLRILFFGILFLFLGMARVSVTLTGQQNALKNSISRYNGQEIKFIGEVVDESIKSSKTQKLKISAEQIVKGESRIMAGGDVFVYTNLYPEYFYGDKLELKCKLKAPEPFDNFRYDKNLAFQGIYSVCYYPGINILSRGNGNIFYEHILSFKDILRRKIYKYAEEPQASILSAIMLGEKNAIGADLRDTFGHAGISHIFSLSGLRIGILGILILYILIFAGISRKKSFYFSVAIVTLYVIMIGAPASTVRAAAMGFLLMFSVKLGRMSKFLNAIIFTAAIMLLKNPGLLFYDISFQFSYGAILGIYFLFPILKRIKIPINEYVKDLLCVTLAAEIAILPLSIYYFSVFSITAPLANILVVWLAPFIIFFGFILFAVPGAIPARIIGIIISFLLKYILIIADSLTLCRWMAPDIKNFPLWAVGLFYTIIAAGIIIGR